MSVTCAGWMARTCVQLVVCVVSPIELFGFGVCESLTRLHRRNFELSLDDEEREALGGSTMWSRVEARATPSSSTMTVPAHLLCIESDAELEEEEGPENGFQEQLDQQEQQEQQERQLVLQERLQMHEAELVARCREQREWERQQAHLEHRRSHPYAHTPNPNPRRSRPPGLRNREWKLLRHRWCHPIALASSEPP